MRHRTGLVGVRHRACIAGRAPPGVEAVTRRQREVAALVAPRPTHGQIAERVLLGAGTVQHRVGNRLRQLGSATRMQPGIWAGCGPYRPKTTNANRTPARADARWISMEAFGVRSGSGRGLVGHRTGDESATATDAAQTQRVSSAGPGV